MHHRALEWVLRLPQLNLGTCMSAPQLQDLEIGGAGPFVIAPGFADALLGIKTLSRVVLGPPCMLPENLEQVKQICLAAEAPGRGLEVLYDHDDARQTQDW